MARTPTRRKKRSMRAAVGRSRPRRVKQTAEDRFVDDLMRATSRVLSKMTRTEREERLRKLNAYLDSLGESVAKRA